MTEQRKNYIKLWRFENAGRVRESNRNWARRNSDKVKKSRDSWLGRNVALVLERRRLWRKNNIDKVFTSELKWLSKHPERSLFPTFVRLDNYPEWQENLVCNSLSPSQILMMKETVVT